METNEVQKLIAHCEEANCVECELFETDYNCGASEFPTMTYEEVKECFNLVFGKKSVEHDNVEHPSHYETGKFECIEVMQEVMGVEALKDFCICNAFKYLYRHKRKNGAEDLQKAKWYLNKFFELEEGEHNETETK